MSENTWFAGRIRSGWRPQDGGLNELFKAQVLSLRQRCALSKTSLGVEEGNTWILYENLPHAGISVYIKVTKVTWLEFMEFGSLSGRYLSPLFRLNFEMAEAIPQGLRRSGKFKTGRTYYEDEFVIAFPQNYPWSPPNFRLQSVNGYGPSHEHHLNQGDWLCIIAGAGDWNGRLDNVASGLGPAFDWAAWHFRNFHEDTSHKRGWLLWNR